MQNNELYHHGVLGMKWGVHRASTKTSGSGRKRPNKKKSVNAVTTAKPQPRKKHISEMTDEEIQRKINRIKLEQSLRALTTPTGTSKSEKGKSFVSKVLEKSGDNIATQATTYVMGTALNKLVGQDIVNPKKGQKDK